MCGRFTLRTPAAELVEIFRLVHSIELTPRFNIAPTQPVAVVRESPLGREMVLLQWGLIPSWADDPRIGGRMINARSETAATKPSFRNALARRRCLIPADGFYEWTQTAGRPKQPSYITLLDEGPFAFAGLWDRWQGPGTAPLESCTILTTQANELLRDLHDRMPVIVPDRAIDRWLDPGVEDPREVQDLLAPYSPAEMKWHPVSTLVNNVRNDAPDCLRPADASRSLFPD